MLWLLDSRLKIALLPFLATTTGGLTLLKYKDELLPIAAQNLRSFIT